GLEIGDRMVQDLDVVPRFPEPHVHDDLRKPRHLERVLVAALLHEGADDRRPEPLPETGRDRPGAPRPGRRRLLLGLALGRRLAVAARLALAGCLALAARPPRLPTRRASLPATRLARSGRRLRLVRLRHALCSRAGARPGYDLSTISLHFLHTRTRRP